MTVTIAFEDSKYLGALYGGRSITKSIAAQVAAVEARLAASDPFITPEAEYHYNPTTGELRVIRDDREVEVYSILPPPSGYWSPAGYKARNTGTLVAIIYNHRAGDNGRTAEGMFDWPIYRAALAILMVNGDIDHAALPVPGPVSDDALVDAAARWAGFPPIEEADAHNTPDCDPPCAACREADKPLWLDLDCSVCGRGLEVALDYDQSQPIVCNECIERNEA
jgi:hypothetical protein